jgi:hypothetical protein
MHALVLALAGLFGSTPEAHHFPDGTLIFLENCNSVVELTTRGEIGHVALVFHDGETAWVYEATPGKVRRVTWGDYHAELARLNKRRDHDDAIRVWALVPLRAYTADEVSKMRTFVDSQIGRRYSVKNYVRGKPYDGIHCAELASTTLNQSGRYAFEQNHKLHPQAFYSAVLQTHAAPDEILIPPPTAKEAWTLRTHRRWTEWWSWCGWSFREVWLFCW